MFSTVKVLLGNEIKRLNKPIIMLVCDSFFTMVFYTMMYFTFSHLIESTLTISHIKNYILIMGIAFIFRSILLANGYEKMQTSGCRAVEKMRINIGDHIRNLNLGYFNKNNIGTLTNIMTGDLQSFEKVLTHKISEIIKIVLLTIYISLITFKVDVLLASLQLVIVFTAIPFMYFSNLAIKNAGNKKRKVIDEVVSRIVEYLSGIQLFKSYNLVGDKFKRLEKSFNNFKKESIKVEVIIAPFVLLFTLIVEISFPILLLICVNRFTNGLISRIDVVLFCIINMALISLLKSFAPHYAELRYFNLASKKLESVFNEKEMEYKYEKVDFKNYDIEFKNVSFEYEPNELVLNNLFFKIKTGTTTALVGPSGSGKTTIMSIIARFWDAKSGEILIGGKDIKNIKPDELLKNISMVFQDVYLLNDTIYNNIKIGNKSATKNQVINAAKIANCNDFINKLDNGYETMVGEGGSTLSGGEKQRISIARAILKDAPIILLDEATSSLDIDNEFEIKKSIDKLTNNKTVLIIAHKLNTIKDSDNIMLLDNGVIEEFGSHDELINKKGKYYKMYNEMVKSFYWNI